MAYLNSSQRSFLEKSVISARKAAESGAVNALKALAVNHHEPYGSMEQDKRTLRNRLRYKSRLIGDILGNNGAQQIDNLATELAYEYWHKMLFAKFLEVNGLLMHPDGVPVSLQDCEELATIENFVDKWQAASVYASKMLPAIFRPEDPIMAVEYAAEDRIKLESILEAIPDETFTADDSLGWVYQFWQSEAKNAINKSGDKIDGKKLPAVTQLFTEPYMVHFLIDNSIGAWWVGRNPGVSPPVEFKYLRFLEDGTPAAGKFEGWPDKTKDVTSLDPCMGSGHFIVAQFEVFVKLRMYEEGLAAEEAAKAVISENLHGLELDPRCTQIAAFNLALAAWKYVGNYFLLPEMNLACSGIAPRGKLEDWTKLVGGISHSHEKARLENGIKLLYEHFQSAPELGSLLDPSSVKADVFTASFEELVPGLKKALEIESDSEKLERGVTAFGITKAALILMSKFTNILTNVPYLARGRHNKCLLEYAENNFTEAKSDLATIFFDRLLNSLYPSGVVSCVIPVYWLYLTSYKKLRSRVLKEYTFNIISKLGSGAFSQISGEVVQVILISVTKQKPTKKTEISTINVSTNLSVIEKSESLQKKEIDSVNQGKQSENPDHSIIITENDIGKYLSVFAHAYQGISPADLNRFEIYFWEIAFPLNGNLIYWQSEPTIDKLYNGFNSLLKFKELSFLIDAGFGAIRGENAWGKYGISIRKAGVNYSSFYLGNKFNTNTAVVIPNQDKYLLPLFCFINSNEFKKKVREIDSKIGITEANITKVKLEYDYWQKVAEEKYPNGLPKPYSDDPTQWLFHGHPVKTEAPLQVAVARFLGYRWPAESDEKMELADEARELINEIKQIDSLSDEDGIVCIPSVNGELAAPERIREFLSKVFGTQWAHNTLEELLKKENTKSSTLETWLREEFFEQHYKLFNNRPFIWQIWDGRKDGFSVLVNYHKLTKENLQKLIYTYLGDWIRQCEIKVKNGEGGADGLLLAAQKLKEKLELILAGENPYDIFVRWKKLEEQPIGWDPDINDGVRLNIRPFIQADVLRKKPNIKWGVDRGKNPPGSPWGEVRDNDRHLSLKEKLEAREKAKK